MPVSLPSKFVDFILLGPPYDRRQLQDSPILGDVWLGYAHAPDQPLELLITPHRAEPSGAVAIAIDGKIERTPDQPAADISPLQGIIAARLYFEEVLRVVIPMTSWWNSERIQEQLKVFKDDEAGRLDRVITAILTTARAWKSTNEAALTDDLLPALDRYIALAGLILWAARYQPPKKSGTKIPPDEALAAALEKVTPQNIADLLIELLGDIESLEQHRNLVWQVSLNRAAHPALDRSVQAVKADAARTLFSVDCSNITWAVIDAGIQGGHPAFREAEKLSRVRKSFDFSNIRQIVSLDNLKNTGTRDAKLDELLHPGLVNRPSRAMAMRHLKKLADDAKARRPTHWELVRPFVEIKPETRPTSSDHGTHVAGIIGASRKGGDDLKESERAELMDGVCPDIQLYDFRVLAPNVRETEFAIIAALQYIRYLNTRTDHITIHGANLSLSIPHDVRNYACGRTPVCIECERLVESGVVVVAAAGNLGYHSYTTSAGSYEGYAAFSVTDPGNAEGVITVGATHRYAPHTYGVSFFSSRGPTGDGRPKPDLVAPGERIRGPFRDGWGDLDGTSMAAPHVSGAAAMLMARYSELIGQPRRIKQLLCESATDLGRERSFQGHGMLDVLRALQRI